MGDLITLFGGIQQYVKENPGSRAHLIATPDLAPLAWNHPDIEFVHTERDPTLPKGTKYFELGVPCPAKAREEQMVRPYIDRIKLFAEVMGIANPQVPRIYLTQEEKDWALDWTDRYLGVARPVLLSWRTRSTYKDYPHIEKLFYRLREKTPVLILEHERPTPGVSTRNLTLRQIVALFHNARLVITGDTGWLHVAGALGRAIFGIYGSQNPVARQGPYNVPGAWASGFCPHGKQPCWEKLCCKKTDSPPCLDIPVDALAKLILATLDHL